MLTLTDLFCGAGGSSTGAIAVPGVRVEMAVNHWALAVETHNTNHPTTRHDCADISQVDPRRYPKTDILWGSPECTNHSIAGKGRLSQDETAVKSRATMWDLLRFTEYHQYRAIVFENVPDVMRWSMLPAWLLAWDNLGYVVRWVFVNSMHAQGSGTPAPQSRNRAYALITRKGDRKPNLRKWTSPLVDCAECGRVRALQMWRNGNTWGAYGRQYVWACPKCGNQVEPAVLPASTAIDWDLPAQRIGDRARPLSPKTMGRIQEGLRRYYPAPQLIPAGGTWNNTPYPVSQPMRTRLTREHEGLLIPVEGRNGKIAHPTSEPLRTQTARNETGLLIPYYRTGTAHSTDEPHRTFTGHDRFCFVVPLRNHNRVKSVTEPFDTIAASGNHHALAMPETIEPEDCYFRMLDPREIMRGMAFPPEYVMLGTKRDRVKLAGNAVCPPNARDLIAAVAEALS
ncbi:DNA cytosine methyltransferase [Nocardia jiangxiensis]|uniref:DNA cytosine methyltransferase n=1 Tax=Nocardia jiangxiensis TaxID=282685 RepID=UPI000592CE88|nr:DNA cytosine methyltransferase [Nocardia jiangxiensis]